MVGMPLSYATVPGFQVWFQLLFLAFCRWRPSEVAVMVPVAGSPPFTWETGLLLLLPGCSQAQPRPMWAPGAENHMEVFSLFIFFFVCISLPLEQIYKWVKSLKGNGVNCKNILLLYEIFTRAPIKIGFFFNLTILRSKG